MKYGVTERRQQLEQAGAEALEGNLGEGNLGEGNQKDFVFVLSLLSQVFCYYHYYFFSTICLFTLLKINSKK